MVHMLRPIGHSESDTTDNNATGYRDHKRFHDLINCICFKILVQSVEHLFCRFLGLKKLGGTGFKASVAVAIVVYIWIHNVAFNIPLLVYTVVRRLDVLVCLPLDAVHSYVLTTRLVNFYVPLIVTWTSYIGIVYRFKRSANKVV